MAASPKLARKHTTTMEPEGSPFWVNLLNATRVRDVLDPHRKLVTAKYNEDAKELLKKMSESHVLGAVIVDDDKPGVWGFVDVLDIMYCVLEVCSESKDITKESMQNLRWEGQCYVRQMAGMLVNISRSDPFQTVSLDATLMDVVKIFAEEVHRVGITDGPRIVNVMSQSDIVSYLATHGVYIGSNMTKPITEAGLPPLGVVSVSDDLNVVDCMKFMVEHGLSAVPVVDKNGRMIANFSATDLLGLNETNFALMGLSVKQYLNKVHGYPKPPVVCTVADTVEAVILKMEVHKVHRVYIVDHSMRPTGIISMTDIMRFLLAY
jgi:CBS domain-containing protein